MLVPSAAASIRQFVLRPFLVGARGGVQQHAIGCGGRLGQSRAVEAEVRRAVRRVAQRQAGQRAVSRNRVLVPLHRMAHVIERAGERLLDAVGIVAVAAAPRGARNQRRFEEQPLRIDDLVVGARPQRAQEIARSPARSWPATARCAPVAAPRPGSPRRPPDAAAPAARTPPPPPRQSGRPAAARGPRSAPACDGSRRRARRS